MNVDNPKWLDETFVQTVLEADSKESLEILAFTTEPAVGPGENYTSFIYRVRVVYKTKSSLKIQSTSLIVKKPIETGLMTEMSGCSSMLDKESQMYQVLLPNMLKKSKIGFAPKSFISPLKNVVVMEDLKEQGYNMTDSKNQLDYSHCKTVLEAIAKFHASSISCYHDDPELVSESVGIDSLWEDGTVWEDWIINATKVTVKVMEEIDVDKKFKDFFLSRADHIWDSTKVAVKAKRKGFNVLNHGDLWENNILFTHDSFNNVTGIKFLDFQNTKFSSPAIDLIFFIWTTASEEVRKSQKNLYEVYLNELNSTLEQLGCPERLSKEELWEDLRAYRDYALFAFCLNLPLMLCDPVDALDLSTFTKEDFNSSKFQQIYDGEYYRSYLPSFSKQFSDFFL